MPTELLVRLCGASDPGFPSKTTLWRVLTGVDTAVIDAVVGAWLGAQARAARHTTNLPNGPGGSELRAVAVDGKTVRGAVDVAGNQTHLLAGATHSEQLVLGHVEVGAKTNEIPMFDSLAATGTDLSGPPPRT